MASAAYDVAALAQLDMAALARYFLNSLESVSTYPLPALPYSSSSAVAATLMKPVSSEEAVVEPLGDGGFANAQVDIASGNEFMDEKSLFDMPNLLVGMADLLAHQE
ncbi:AP2/ERF transcription factor [Abeliophyllum distichum]|uniref:AP2/ERF transcription factor n=1 Tax=Abeliophyllum distichum TaxID=126358 RepID=A0ABD1W2Q0_9LAMI